MLIIMAGKSVKGNINVTVAPAAGSDAEGEDPAAGE